MQYSQKYTGQTVIIAIGITCILTVSVIWVYSRAASSRGSIVIPAGNTYLGPNRPDTQKSVTQTPPQKKGIFSAQDDAPWTDVRGSTYPYVMSVPTTLTLIQPEGTNPYDLYGISWGGYDPASNVLIGVDSNVNPKLSKIEYVRAWWKQFSGLKGAASVDPFTNQKGLKGYKARYINSSGETPNLDVFFEVPGRPELVIHLANGILDPEIFDKIIDSVRWEQ